MALDRLLEDMNFVRNMGDDPKRDDGLSTQEFKSVFELGGVPSFQQFYNFFPGYFIPVFVAYNIDFFVFTKNVCYL